MAAKFRVDAVFSIEGRGIVLQGSLVSGQISRGMTIKIPGTQRHYRIGAVEEVYGSRIPAGSIGLVLEGDAPGDVKKLATVLEGETVDVE
jgi:selenocysteine-specific translation elongation factor